MSKEPRASYTVKEFAKLHRLDIATVYEAVKRRQIPCVRVGRRILIDGNIMARTDLFQAVPHNTYPATKPSKKAKVKTK